MGRCIGCGRCASGCPEDAIKMVMRKQTAHIEKTNSDLWNKIKREAIFGIVKRKLLGK